MLRRWRQFRALGPGKRALFLQAVALLPLVGPTLHCLSFRRALAYLEARREAARRSLSEGDRDWAQKAAETIELAGRHGIVRASCLDRSLLLVWLLARRGIAGELRIGVDRENDSLRAHAWVECGGMVLGDPEEVVQGFFPFEEG